MTGGKFQDRITKLKKPLKRRIGNLIIRITTEGLFLRGHRRRYWKYVSWQEVAAVIDTPEMLLLSEIKRGAAVLEEMTVSKKGKDAKPKS